MHSDHETVSPWMGLVLAPVLIVACVYGAWVNGQQYFKFPRHPTEVSVSDGNRHLNEWVTLGDARFHCDRVFESEWSVVRGVRDHSTYIIMTDAAETRAVVGLYPGVADCSTVSTASARGVLIPFAGTQVAGLTKAGLRFPGASASAAPVLLCTSCGPGNSLLGIAWFGFELRRRAKGPQNNRLQRTAHGPTVRRR